MIIVPFVYVQRGEELMNDSLETRRVPDKPVGRSAIVVTGASSGIGRACALRLARSGFHVFAGIRKDKDAEALEYAARKPA